MCKPHGAVLLFRWSIILKPPKTRPIGPREPKTNLCMPIVLKTHTDTQNLHINPTQLQPFHNVNHVFITKIIKKPSERWAFIFRIRGCQTNGPPVQSVRTMGSPRAAQWPTPSGRATVGHHRLQNKSNKY